MHVIVLLTLAPVSHSYSISATVILHWPAGPAENATTLILQLRKMRFSQMMLLPKFMYPAMDGGGMGTQVSQSPALDSGLESSEAVQIHFHVFFLLLFSKCTARVLTMCLGNIYTSQLSLWWTQCGRPNRYPQGTHINKSTVMTHGEIPCENVALGNRILIHAALFSLVGQG